MDPFGVTAPMDFDTLSHLVDVKSKPGLHYEYQYGFKIRDDIVFPWPDPLYSGCTARVFLYAHELKMANLLVFNGIKDQRVAVRFDKGKVSAMYKDTSGEGDEARMWHVQKGAHFSIAVRMEQDRYLRGLYKRYEFDLHDMETLIGSMWIISIKSGDIYLTSFHLYDELKGSPKDGLGTAYEVSPLVMYIGSVVTVVAVFTGQTNGTITISFEQDDGEVSADFTKVPLHTGEEFKIIIQNTALGWQVAPLFPGNAPTATIVARKSYENRTVPNFSSNCYMKKISGVCAAVIQKYRNTI